MQNEIRIFETTNGINTLRYEHAKLEFLKLDFEDPNSGDVYFQIFGVGSVGTDGIHTSTPYERTLDYENLLKILLQIDKIKFKKIHKGTPYYFMAWAYFQMRHFEKAVYYMDAAISEDIRKTIYDYNLKNPSNSKSDNDLTKELINDWLENPAGRFFTLSTSQSQAAKPITDELRTAWEKQIKRFNELSSSDISLQDGFIEKFIKKLAEKQTTKSIITALYSFILEYDDIELFLNLRSTGGGSLEPILTYLFKGGLIFESLLKEKFPNRENGTPIKTLGEIKNNSEFSSLYVPSINTSSYSLREIVENITNSDVQTAFDTTAKIRNTTGHNLQWDDIFDDLSNFKKLFEQVINSYLYICKISYL